MMVSCFAEGMIRGKIEIRIQLIWAVKEKNANGESWVWGFEEKDNWQCQGYTLEGRCSISLKGLEVSFFLGNLKAILIILISLLPVTTPCCSFRALSFSKSYSSLISSPHPASSWQGFCISIIETVSYCITQVCLGCSHLGPWVLGLQT